MTDDERRDIALANELVDWKLAKLGAALCGHPDDDAIAAEIARAIDAFYRCRGDFELGRRIFANRIPR